MKIPINKLSMTPELPDVYLCETDKTIIGAMNVTSFNGTFKFNAYSEISFEFDRTYEDFYTGEQKINILYDKCEPLRILYVVGYGYFEIQSAEINTNGIREYKSVTAYSLEYQLSSKYLRTFIINQGTDGSIDGVQLVNQADISKSLAHLILEGIPNWTIGHTDIELSTLQRSFEEDEITVYDFLMNNIEEAFKCIVLFDTNDCTINFYNEDTAGEETDIYIAMDTIANECTVDYSADDIKTKLFVYGADDLSIREVNLGQPYLLNLDYYNTIEWLGQDLYDTYNAYLAKVASYREQYTELMAQWNELYNQLSTLYNQVPDYEEDPDVFNTVNSKDDLPTASESLVSKRYKVNDGGATWYYVCKSKLENDTTIYYWELDIDCINAFYDFPTPSAEYAGGVYLVYNHDNPDGKNGALYYKCVFDKFDSNNVAIYKWVLAETGYGINLLKEKEQIYLDIQEVQVAEGWGESSNPEYHRYEENYNKLIDIQAQLKIKQAEADEISAQMDEILTQVTAISQEIDTKNNFTDEQLIRLNPLIREDSYTNDNILVTEYDDDATIFKIKQDLLEDAQKELEKIAQPQLAFSMSLANILALEEFEPIWEHFEPGAYVNVEIRHDYIKRAQILEININFDDPSDFSVTFGNLKALYSEIDRHADILSAAISAGQSVASSSSYWTKGANQANSINKRIENGLIDANTSIKGTENQAIEWDNRGIHLRKYADSTMTTYLDEQVWLNNEQIVFTDDNWHTARMALGKYNDPEIGECWGIIAPNIVGTLLAGEKLVIDSAHEDGTLSSFRVDSNGARLYNSTFLMEKTDSDGTSHAILLDPNTGIVAGSGIYDTTSDGTIVPSLTYNDGGPMPDDTSFYLDISTGSAFFKGTVYAESGYFSGELKAATGSFEGKITANDGYIGGWTIEEGHLYSGEGTKSVVLSSSTDRTFASTDYAIWAGAVAPTDAPFRVSRDGSLYAKKGIFGGQLEAATGSFKGSINVNDQFQVDSYGNVITSGYASIGGYCDIGGTCDIGADTTISGDLDIYGTYGVGQSAGNITGYMGYAPGNNSNDGVGISTSKTFDSSLPYFIVTDSGVRMQYSDDINIVVRNEACEMNFGKFSLVASQGGCWAVDRTKVSTGEWTNLFEGGTGGTAVFG